MDDAENTFGPSNYGPCGCVMDPSVLYTPKTCIITGPKCVVWVPTMRCVWVPTRCVSVPQDAA